MRPPGSLENRVEETLADRAVLHRAAIVIGCTALLIMALFRFIDGDEGFYLLTAKLVREQRVPYAEFFYPQTPYLPYIYAPLTGSGLWSSWYAGRLLSAAIAAAAALLLYRAVKVAGGGPFTALCAVLFFLSAELTLPWIVTVKAFSLTILLTLGAYLLICRGTGVSIFFAGALLGAAAGARSYLGLLLPAVLLHLAMQPEARKMSRLATFSGGAALALLPVLWFAVNDWERFYFNNVEFHLNRSYLSPLFAGPLESKLQLIGWLLGGSLLELHTDGSELLIIVCAATVSILQRRNTPRISLAGIFAATILCTCLLPSPIHPQYFSLAVPFLLIDAAPALFTRLERRRYGGVCVAVLFAALAGWTTLRFTWSGDGVPGMSKADAPEWRIDAVRAVSREIDRVAAPQQLVATFWPGYLVDSHATILPGLENHFARQAANNIDAVKRARYGLLSLEDIARELLSGQGHLVVFGNWIQQGQREILQRAVLKRGYRSVGRAGAAEILAPPQETLGMGPQPVR